ncbi:MAG TPA: bifunctional phosphopantothenoylcysteine decarboxylase/phosphopantothenate--cysteine ligase CoaBC [Kiloniellales bacterium]|nr:bifunctional phosphopantothenoylcysteine decarboxylase/phosphopantothenate--cysteine ligase CoaBC [Kiloniellales bacterium]
MLQGKRILLIVSGGIAAYKALELVRRLRERGAEVRAILTKGGAEFITPLSLSALTEDRVYSDLFSLTDEAEMGHIQLSRAADLLVVAPATADILAKMTAGIADDLATTALLATDKPVLVAPAMNVRMWQHAATQENIGRLRERGVHIVGPNKGPMACGEFGPGRMAEVMEIIAAIERRLGTAGALAGRKALVTSGPTHEPIDPVRYIANRSSGRQGHAIAEAFAAAGAETLLVSGPVSLDDPPGVRVIKVESAREMLEACLAALPVDVAVGAAAVADWRVAGVPTQKLKKKAELPELKLEENPDILAQIARHREARPRLVIGFAAETERVAEQGRAKRQRKGCDWILANDVSAESGTFGGADNEITLIDDSGAETWPRLSKHAVARRLVERVARHLASESKR